MRAATVIAKASVLGVLAALLWVPAVARADITDGVDPTGTGYTVTVAVTFSGSGVGNKTYTKSVSVSASCYWAPAAPDYQDAVKMLAWYDALTNGGQQTRGNIDSYGPRSIWKAEADAETAGTANISWYRAYCQNPADYTKFGVGSVENTGTGGVIDPVLGNPTTYVTFLYHPFNAGEAIPPPLVSSAELARVASAELKAPVPATDRNPMIKAPGAPTLVGLPTWFWVTNPLAVGGDAGELDVTAEVNAPGRPQVTATVFAHTDGLNITSNYGNKNCGPVLAQVHYAAGVLDSNACTVVFSHAAQGLGVTMSTDWTAYWTGTDSPAHTDIALPNAHQEITEQVAIAEVQNIVTR